MSDRVTLEVAPPMSTLRRLWTYAHERFPLETHVPLIAVFSGSTVCYSMLARGRAALPDPRALLVAFITAFFFFLQLRVADEFKDAEDDARYRPYRPVPRGLVTLHELAHVALFGAVIQAALALWLAPGLLPFLLLVWVYLGLMSKEFFARHWLRAHPVAYLLSHMLILPLIDLYGTACDWRVTGVAAPTGLFLLLAASFCNGTVLEIGRKIRAPKDEESGVETYSALWGRRRAVAAWLAVLGVTAGCAVLAASRITYAVPASPAMGALLVAAVAIGVRFLRRPGGGRAHAIELTSGVWTLLMYLFLGPLPLLVRL
jgi:4-hydroxybenzoate polyprenyltransferase